MFQMDPYQPDLLTSTNHTIFFLQLVYYFPSAINLFPILDTGLQGRCHILDSSQDLLINSHFFFLGQRYMPC